METKKTYGFDNMSKDPRTWIFQSATLLSDTQKNIVATELDQFLQKWAAHGTELFAAFEIRYNRFIIIALDEDHSSASGCSIDSMMRLIQKLDDEFSLKLLDRTRVTYKVGDEIRECDANTYRRLWSAGEVDENTIVFNNIAQSIGEMERSWEGPACESWHANLAP